MLNALSARATDPGEPAAATPAMRAITDLLQRRTGQQLVHGRAWRIDTVLQPLLRARGYDALEQLVAALPRDGSGPLASAVVDALLNQETSFYRDAGVIDAIGDLVITKRQAAPGRRVRMWSAGCSTGQEPYSLAMLLAEGQTLADSMPDIVATDVSDRAIMRARTGRYSQFEIQRGLPIRRLLGWFDQDGEEWIARPELAKLVSFRRQNLVADPAPYGQFDVILCRNVLLYFPPAVRSAVFDRLADALRPDGQLVLGAGETTIGQTARFRPSTVHRGAYELADQR